MVIILKVYIEYVFILNYLLDFMILYGTKKLLKLSSSFFRIFLSSIIGAFSIIFLYIKISTGLMILFKILIGTFMNLISFGKTNLINHTLYFYMISILIGGGLYLFDIHLTYYIHGVYLVCFFYIFIMFYKKIYSHYKMTHTNKYDVELFLFQKKYQLIGYLDTGNQLTSPYSHKPIIIVNLNIHFTPEFYIPYRALNTEGIIPCIRPDKVVIGQKEIKNCLIGFSKEKFVLEDCNCILPNQLKERL